MAGEYNVYSPRGENAFSTSNGLLPCKKIFFVPWKADRSDPTSLQPSVSKFVSTVIEQAVKDNHQSIGKIFLFTNVRRCLHMGFDCS